MSRLAHNRGRTPEDMLPIPAPSEWTEPETVEPQPVEELTDAQLLAFTRAVMRRATLGRFYALTVRNVAAEIVGAGFTLTTDQIVSILDFTESMGLTDHQKDRWVLHEGLRSPEYNPKRDATLADHFAHICWWGLVHRDRTAA